tara:strand:- start:526 stop:702 length:177 start_codon:yes stop_codon:yes gene_type:complete
VRGLRQLLAGGKGKIMRQLCLMTKRVCPFLLIMKLVAVMLLASNLPAHASAIWGCELG